MQTIGIEGKFHLIHDTRYERKEYYFKNKILYDGKKALLNDFFRRTSTYSAFYMGLIKDTWNHFTENEPTIATLIAAEFTTYTPVNRKAITFEAAALDGSYIMVQNSTSNYCTFTIGGAVTNQKLYGVFIAPVNTGTPTQVYCTAAFGNDDTTPLETIIVNTGDVLRLQYMARIPTA